MSREELAEFTVLERYILGRSKTEAELVPFEERLFSKRIGMAISRPAKRRLTASGVSNQALRTADPIFRSIAKRRFTLPAQTVRCTLTLFPPSVE